ncbi:MAG TPA: hypothetical protein VKC56_00775 [Gallionellaceae bacterium]|nr:hypothetical protein [Gallionellaceae bacterium]
MKRSLFAVLFALLAPVAAHAAEYKSSFGFKLALSDDWLVVSPENVSRQYANRTLASLNMTKVDSATARDILARVKTGKVEFYFEKKYSVKGFTNNISTQVMAGGDIPTPDNVKAFCPTLPAQLAKVQGAPVQVKVCRFAQSSGIPYVVVEYSVPSRGITIVQHQIPFLPNSDFQVIGGANDAGLDTVRAATDDITAAATQYVAAMWNARVPDAREQTALAQDAMHHFALAVNARDFTGFHDYIAKAWRRDITVAQLDNAYRGFMDSRINLLPLDHIAPRVEQEPQQRKNGTFFIKGYYPIKSAMVTFKFGYMYEPPNWKLVLANIHVKSAP